MSESDKVVLRSGKQLTEYAKKRRSKGKASAVETGKASAVEAGEASIAEAGAAYVSESDSAELSDLDFDLEDNVFQHNVEPDAMADDKDKAIADLQKQLDELKAALQKKEDDKKKLQEELEGARFVQGNDRGRGQVHIVDSASSLQMPCYRAGKISPESFLLEVEEYFRLKGAERDTWVMLISRMLPHDSDISRWWRESKAEANDDWDIFKDIFIKYEKSGYSNDELLSKLFATKQRLSDAFETYAWEVNTLYKKIEADVDPREIVDRILNSCLPEIAVVLRHSNCQSVAKLICQAREVIGDLNKIRKFENKPLFRARATDPIENIAKQESGGFRKFNKFKSNYQPASQDSKQAQEANQQKSEADQPNVQDKETSAKKHDKARKNKQCTYCNFKGHNYDECRFRLNKEKNNSQGHKEADAQAKPGTSSSFQKN